MQLTFYGTIDKLKETIYLKAKEYNKDIVIYENQPNTLEIGFQRLSHSSGSFFIANTIEDGDKVILEGEIKDVSLNQKKTKAGRIWAEITDYLLAYCLLEILLIIPWLFLKDIVNIWIPLILPVIYLIIRYFLNKKETEKINQDFINFMSSCAIYTTDKQYWDDEYKRLNLAGGKLKAICDDDQDMLLITYPDGMQIDVGYIQTDKTYYITVMQNDSIEAWNKPLGVFSTNDKSKLPTELQKAINKYRNI